MVQRIDHKMRWSCHGDSDAVLLYLKEGVIMMREQQQAIREIAAAVFKRMTTDQSGDWGMAMDSWDWVPGVGLIAIMYYGTELEQEDALAYVKRWVERNEHLAGRAPVINAIAPYTVLPVLYEREGNELYLQKAVSIGDWLLEQAPKTREGAFEHTVTEAAAFPEQVWADTLFMAVLFLAKLAKATGEVKYAEEAFRQLEIHLSLLQDEQTGVLFHGWNCGEGHHMSAARWARANAWVVLATPWIISEIGQMVTISEEVTTRYKRLAEGLISYQGANGLWPTVVDQPDYYSETSGSAGIVAGLLAGAQAGLLDNACLFVAESALQGVLSTIAVDGTVLQVSGGTPVLESIAAYNEVPCYPALYGQGLALIMLTMIIVLREGADPIADTN